MSNDHPDYSDYDIVGFDSTPTAECGRSLPLLRQRTTNSFFTLTNPTHHPHQEPPLHEDLIHSWSNERRITMLPRSVPAFPNAVAVYVRENPLHEASPPRPNRLEHTTLTWQKLPDLTPLSWVTLVPLDISTALLDHWGSAFRDLSTRLLGDHLADRQETTRHKAEIAAQTARAAAISPRLRCEVFLRHGLAVLLSTTPERLNTIFNIIVHKEYPRWSRDDFVSLIHNLGDILSARVPLQNASARAPIAPQKARAWDPLLRAAQDISALKTNAARTRRARDVAHTHRSVSEPTQAKIQELKFLIKFQEAFALTDDLLAVVGSEPAAYLPRVLKSLSDDIYLVPPEFVQAASTFEDPPPGSPPTLTDLLRQEEQQPNPRL